MNCQTKCNTLWDFLGTNLVVFVNAKLSWAWRWSTPGSFSGSRDWPLTDSCLSGKTPAAVRSGSRSFLFAMHSTDRRNTYRSAALSLSLSNRRTRSLGRRWSSLPLLSGTWKARLWPLSPSFLLSCPGSSPRYSISSFSPRAWQNTPCFSFVPTPLCPLPNARTLCGCIRSYPVCVCFSPSWIFRRSPAASAFFLSCVSFSEWNEDTFRLSNDKWFWTTASSSRTVFWRSVRETTFATVFRLCNPTPLASRTSRGDGNCSEDCFSFAPYTDNKPASRSWMSCSAWSPEKYCWHSCPKVSQFRGNFSLWHSILVDNSALLW